MSRPVVHAAWAQNRKRSSACDFCNLKNVSLQQCQTCSLNVCKECLSEGKLEANPTHMLSRASANSFDWHQTRKEKVKATAAKRTHSSSRRAQVPESPSSHALEPEKSATVAQSQATPRPSGPDDSVDGFPTPSGDTSLPRQLDPPELPLAYGIPSYGQNPNVLPHYGQDYGQHYSQLQIPSHHHYPHNSSYSGAYGNYDAYAAVQLGQPGSRYHADKLAGRSQYDRYMPQFPLHQPDSVIAPELAHHEKAPQKFRAKTETKKRQRLSEDAQQDTTQTPLTTTFDEESSQPESLKAPVDANEKAQRPRPNPTQSTTNAAALASSTKRHRQASADSSNKDAEPKKRRIGTLNITVARAGQEQLRGVVDRSSASSEFAALSAPPRAADVREGVDPEV